MVSALQSYNRNLSMSFGRVAFVLLSGLSLSFEAGVTLKSSPVTCKYLARGH